jgi:hypothetical protein
MKPKFTIITAIFSLLLLFQLAGCEKKKKEETELITTVKVIATNATNPGGTFIWKDADGDGGNPPSSPDTIQLDSGVSYSIKLEFLDESSSPAKDITAEIKAEEKEHRICFTSSNSSVSIQITDTDGKFPLGLESTWIGSMKGKSKLRIVLRHQPDAKDGTCDLGETDVDVEFPLVIK